MTLNELHTKLLAAKRFLNDEMVRLKTNNADVATFDFRQIGDRLDMIHEVERIGIRNLSEREMRKVTKMITMIEENQPLSVN